MQRNHQQHAVVKLAVKLHIMAVKSHIVAVKSHIIAVELHIILIIAVVSIDDYFKI